MLHSTDRFLTTHTGSLPRPEDLVTTMFAKQEGVPVDAEALGERIRLAVEEVVGLQTDAGVDLVNDGEMSKPSYATYVKDRLAGFGGESQRMRYGDLEEFPAMRDRVFGDRGRSRRRSPACIDDVTVVDAEAARIDARNLAEALGPDRVERGFMSAASPGVIALFFRNDHYPSHEAYVHAIAEAMRHEYEAVAEAGFTLQIDCPDLAMGRHIQFSDLDVAAFRDRMRTNIEALNGALANIPPEQLRIHVCWGNYEGPHHCDVPLEEIIDVVFTARPHAIAFEAANPRHAHEYELFDRIALPDDKVIIPGVLESKANFVEHPELIAQRIGRYAERVGKERVIAGSDCGYGTWVGQSAVDPQVVWAKMAAMAEGARIASERYFR